MHSIVEGLRSSNEIRQSEAASELAEMLLLGNEESLPNMPVRDIIQCLMVLLQKDHNFELMLTAARCITNMQEALPRALPIITEAIPLLLQKLKRIEYIDVAEQSLIALEVMSRRNAKNILLAVFSYCFFLAPTHCFFYLGGIAATISHVDFFSLPSQRLAFQIAANCAIYVGANEFAFLKDCLSDLTQRLNFVDDKRCVESICTFFNRLIENVRHHPDKLREIAGANHEFLKNVQRLLTIQPSTIGSNTFLSLLKSMRYMCSKCGDIAVGLITMDIGRTIRYLLVGPAKSDDANSSSNNFDITARPAQQLREIIELIGELLPNLPNTEVFEVTSLLNHYMNSGSFPRCQYPFDVLAVNWYAINESGTEWRLLGPQETGALEQAKGSSEQMAVLQMEGDVFDVDFSRMLRRSQTTGVESALDRRITSMHNTSVPPPPLTKYGMDHNEIDDRELLKRTKNEMFLELIAMLFPLLVEVGTVSTCSSLRFDTLRVMMRMIYAVESETQLRKILSEVPLAIYISSTLSSNKSLGVLVSALQLVHILLEKIPHLYVPLLEAEGVFHEIRKLMKPVVSKPATSFASMVTSTSHRGHENSRRQPQQSQPPPPSPASNTSDLSSYLVAASSSANQQFNPMQSQHNAYYQHHTLRSHPHLDVAASNSALQHFQQQLQMSHAQLAAAAGGMLGGGGAQAHPTSFFNTNMMPSVINQVNNPNMPTAEMLMARAHAAFPSLSSMALPPPLPVYLPSSSSQQHQQQMAAASDALAAAATAALVPPPPSSSTTNHMPNSSALKQAIVDKLQEFVSTESAYIIRKYTVGENAIKYGTDKGNTGDGLLELLAGIAQQLSTHHRDVGCDPLNALKKELRLRRFAALFMMLDADTLEPHISRKESLAPFERLVTKVLLAIGQLEQFHVKITNLSGIQSSGGGGTPISHATGASGLLNASALTSTTYLRGAQALRFFQTHQIKCSLKRHPSCKQLKEWRHGRGSIKVDPFTSISAIERYLVDRGIGVANQPAEGDSSDNEDISDEEQDLSYQSSAASYNGRIELYIGEQKIPSDISILQAIRQFSLPHEEDTQETIPSSIWITAHTLYYRTAEASVASNSTAVDPSIYIGSASASNSGASSPSTSTRSSTAAVVGGSSSRTLGATSFAPTTSSSGTAEATAVSSDNISTSVTKNNAVYRDGHPPKRECPLETYLKSELSHELNDPAVGCLILLKTLYGLNKFWWSLFDGDQDYYSPPSHSAILPLNVFHSSKLNSKVSRQLSDFLSVATQQIPKWTTDLVKAVPFAFPFITRRNLLYCTSFGRDRALMHLVNEGTGDDHDGESTSRLIPRLERRKVSINRTNLLKDAQQTLTQLGSSKAMLEVGFDGEVGTGFGPTLEFYSTLSKEIQKHSLKLWYGKAQKCAEHEMDESGDNEYTTSENGLYPCIYRPASSKQMDARLKKFEFFGRLLAQSLLDSRMLDIPIASTFFKWVIGEENSLGLDDLEVLEPTLYKSLHNMSSMSELDFDGLDTYFLFPGENSFEMVKGGKNALVRKSNFKQFVELVCYWRLVEGVRPEMEAVRRGLQTVVNTDSLKIFFPDELEQLFCGCPESGQDDKIWSKSALQQAIRPDHGFSHDSVQIGWLVEMLNTYPNEKRRKFLQFVTGSPRLPVGGFRSLNPPLTVVRKTASYGNSEHELPSAMTCYNYLKIPPYETYATFVERFDVALQFIYSFHLT
uniref:E3 ubiquitin-protein ligase n=1 Tax=Ditylenchus dipsaci TaxID=166011 RepID=A0A915ES34_9BILA